VCAPDDGWKYHPKYVEQFPDINKLCDVASCCINEYIGILLGARPILHISRIKVKMDLKNVIATQKLDSFVLQRGRVPCSCKHGTEPSCSTMRGIS
jgi:hypothetical protein